MQGEREESGSVNMEKKKTMKKRWVLDQAVRHAIEETWAVFTNGAITPNPALFLARLADLARSNAFLSTEAGLQVQGHATRVVPVGQSLSRSLALATVTADINVQQTYWQPSSGSLSRPLRLRRCPARDCTTAERLL